MEFPIPSLPHRSPLANNTVLYSEYWYGMVDEVRIWNVARSQVQIQQAYKTSLTGSETGLVGYWKFDDGGASTNAVDASSGGHPGTLNNGPVWKTDSNQTPGQVGLLAQYILRVDMADSQPPSVVSTSLPGEGTTSTDLIDRLTVNFSEDMSPATVTNTANYQLISAGVDGTFGTPDDLSYTIVPQAYTSGLQVTYFISDGPFLRENPVHYQERSL